MSNVVDASIECSEARITCRNSANAGPWFHPSLPSSFLKVLVNLLEWRTRQLVIFRRGTESDRQQAGPGDRPALKNRRRAIRVLPDLHIDRLAKFDQREPSRERPLRPKCRDAITRPCHDFFRGIRRRSESRPIARDHPRLFNHHEGDQGST